LPKRNKSGVGLYVPQLLDMFTNSYQQPLRKVNVFLPDSGIFQNKKAETGFHTITPTWEQRKNMSDIF